MMQNVILTDISAAHISFEASINVLFEVTLSILSEVIHNINTILKDSTIRKEASTARTVKPAIH